MMHRGDLVTVVVPGDFGKPRPALILQSDLFVHHPSVTIAPLTSELRDTPLFRIPIEPRDDNGLRVSSQVLVDKIQAVSRARIEGVMGRLNDREMLAIERAIAVFLGFA